MQKYIKVCKVEVNFDAVKDLDFEGLQKLLPNVNLSTQKAVFNHIKNEKKQLKLSDIKPVTEPNEEDELQINESSISEPAKRAKKNKSKDTNRDSI